MSQPQWDAARRRAEELTEPQFSRNTVFFGVRYSWTSFHLARDLITLLIYLRAHGRSQPVDEITAEYILSDVGDTALPTVAWHRDWEARDAARDTLKQQLTERLAATGVDLHAPNDDTAAKIAAMWWQLDRTPAPETGGRSDRIDVDPVIRQHFLLEAAQHTHTLLAEPAIAGH